MSVRRTQHVAAQLPGHRDVIDIAAETPYQIGVLLARNRLPDAIFTHGSFPQATHCPVLVTSIGQAINGLTRAGKRAGVADMPDIRFGVFSQPPSRIAMPTISTPNTTIAPPANQEEMPA